MLSRTSSADTLCNSDVSLHEVNCELAVRVASSMSPDVEDFPNVKTVVEHNAVAQYVDTWTHIAIVELCSEIDD